MKNPPEIVQLHPFSQLVAWIDVYSNAGFEYEIGDITWAKLEGYPWWPSIVCRDPNLDKHVMVKDKHTQIHVQFFEEPKPKRAWCKAK